MVTLYANIFAILFLLSSQATAMDRQKSTESSVAIDKILLDKFTPKLVQFLDRNISNSKHHGQVFKYYPFADLEKGILKIAISFTETIKDDKNKQNILISFLERNAKKFFKKAANNTVEKPPVRLKQIIIQRASEDFISVPTEVLNKFAMNLFQQTGGSFEAWQTKTYRDDEEKIIVLRDIFQDLIFTNGLSKNFAEFKNKNNLTSCTFVFEDIFFNLDAEFAQNNQKISESIDKFHKRVSVHVESQKNWIGEHLASYTIDLTKILEKIQEHDQYVAWSKLQSLSQFAHDGLSSQQTLLDLFYVMQKKVLEFNKYHKIIENILDGISAEDQPKLVLYVFLESDILHQSNLQSFKELQFNINKEIQLIKKNIAFFEEVNFHADVFLLKMFLVKALTFSEDSNLPLSDDSQKSKPSNKQTLMKAEESSCKEFPLCQNESTSSTKECRAQAQEQMTKEFARKAKKQARTNNAIKLGETKAEENKNSDIKEIKLLGNKNQELFEIEPVLLIDNSEIYISFTFAAHNEKIKTFLDTGKRLKIIKHDSLGQNGLKIYGLEFLIIKNKKFPGEHLLFISHPINEGTAGYVFLPYKLVSHKFYEKLLDEPQLLKNTQILARDPLTVLRK